MASGIWLLAIGQLFCWSALYFIFPAALLSWEEHYGWQRSELTLAFTLAVSVSALLSPLFLWIVIVFSILHGAGHGTLYILRPVIARTILGNRNFGAINGAMALPCMLCFALAPLVGALFWQFSSYTMLIWILIVASITALSFLVTALHYHKQTHNPDYPNASEPR